MADGEKRPKTLEEITTQFEEYSAILLDNPFISKNLSLKSIANAQTALDLAKANPTAENIAVAKSTVDLFHHYAIGVFHSDARRFSRDRHKIAATTDSLTNSPNRAVHNERIHNAQREMNKGPDSDGNKNYFALVVFDLDRFKGLNDDYGHLAGDAGLKAFADHLRSITRDDRGDDLYTPLRSLDKRSDHSFSRLGGDEFTLLMNTKASTLEEAQDSFTTAFTRIRDHFKTSSFSYESMTFPLIPSSGMHILEKDDDTDSAFKKADAAQLEHKANKHERYQAAVTALQDANVENLRIVADKREEEATDNATLLSALQALTEDDAVSIHVDHDKANAFVAKILLEIGDNHDIPVFEAPPPDVGEHSL